MSDTGAITVMQRWTSNEQQWRWTCNRCWSKGRWTGQSEHAALLAGRKHERVWHR